MSPHTRALGTAAHNLPRQPSPLIGRQHAIETARQQFLSENVRLLTILGPGGIGKTRLAVEVASSLLDEFAYGAWFVDLSPLGDSVLVLPAIAQALGIRGASDRPAHERVKRYLKNRELLLLLDNFEQVLPAAGEVAELLTSCADLKVLATSREPLRLRWEHRFPVPPLALPDLRTRRGAGPSARSASVALFVERARAVNPHFTLTDENAVAIAEICIRLDGLPLAIELAAAQTAVLTPAAMLDRLQHRLPLLRLRGYDLPARHQTLRGAIGWSYDLLAPEEQVLFRRLGVFASGWTLETARSVVGPDASDPAILDVLASLVDKSLVQVTCSGTGQPRFAMLETIREYALEQLAAHGEEEAVRQRHADYFLTLAEQAEPRLKGTEQGVWLAQLEQEYDNLRAVLAWGLAEPGRAEIALRLSGSLAMFWTMRGNHYEGRYWLDATLAATEGAPPTAQAPALVGAGWLAACQADSDRATALLERSLALSRGLGDNRRVSVCLTYLGRLAMMQGDFERAEACYAECLALSRELDDNWAIARILRLLGDVARLRGDHDRAQALLTQCLALRRELGDHWGAAWTLYSLGNLAKDRGENKPATACYQEGMTVMIEQGSQDHIVDFLEGLARVAGELGQSERAARLFGAAAARREASGTPLWPHERTIHEQSLADVRATLSERAFAAAWAQGRTMPQERVIEDALARFAPKRGSDVAAAGMTAKQHCSVVLSERERQTLRLVASGLTNKQIGRSLGLAERTVKANVTGALNKLGADNRAQAAVLATQLNLL